MNPSHADGPSDGSNHSKERLMVLIRFLGGAVLTAFAALAAQPLEAPAAAQPAEAFAVEAPPCGALAGSYNPRAKPTYSHVVVLMEENLSYNTWRTTNQAPYSHQLANSCGEEINFHAATHPSQPNYMAATSGVATPFGVMTSNANIFQQLQAAGGTWRNYAEGMSTPCQQRTTTFYKPGHAPAYWYTNLRTPVNTCAKFNVPMSPALDNAIATDNLPSYSWITPNLCHAFAWKLGCPTVSSRRIAEGDKWLSTMIPRLTALPSYQAGKTLIIITWDEGNTTNPIGIDCTDPTVYSTQTHCSIPTFVLSPYIRPGTKDGADHNLYGLLATTEDVMRLPRLGRAIGQTSMRPGLRF